MRLLAFLILAMTTRTVFGQGTKLPSYSTKLVYAINSADTTQRMLIETYTQDSCGNETSYCEFDYIDYNPFESQRVRAKKIKDMGFREYSYASKCKPTVVRILDKDKKLVNSFLYSYNKDSTIGQLIILNGNGKQHSKFKYEYNNGNLISEIRYNEEDKPDYITTYKYGNGLKSEETRVDLDMKDTLVCHYTYNFRKELIVEEWSKLNESGKEFEISFYENFQKLKEIFMDEDGKVREYRMTYYPNGLKKTWKQVDYITGNILTYECYEYELYK